MNLSKRSSTFVLALLGAGVCFGQAATTPPAAEGSSVVPVPADAGAVSEAKAKAKETNAALGYDYRIGAGDQLLISVWKEPEASASVTVRPDGKISLPLLKEVSVIGMTPVEVEEMITGKLTKVITEPDVTVVVTGIHSLKIFVVGAVKSTSTIAYTYQMTVMQAISEAGGLTDYAKKKKIYVIRKVNGKDTKLFFDYDRAIKGGDADDNIMLLPGDTLVVPQ